MKHRERTYIQHDYKRNKLGLSYGGNEEEEGTWEAIKKMNLLRTLGFWQCV